MRSSLKKRGQLSQYGVCQRAGRSGVRIPTRINFSSPQPPRQALGPTQHPIQWLPGFISEWWSGRGVKLTTHLYQISRLRIVAAIPLVPCMPWCELGDLYLVTTMVHTDTQKRPCVHCTLHTFLIFLLSFFDWSLLFRSAFSLLPSSFREQTIQIRNSVSPVSFSCKLPVFQEVTNPSCISMEVRQISQCFIKWRPAVKWMCSFTHWQ